MSREIGKLKWFGGFNSKKGIENDFGFIESISKRDIFVHRNDVLSDTVYLVEGVLVSYIAIEGSKGLQAKELKLLRPEDDREALLCAFDSVDITIFTTVVEVGIRVLGQEWVVDKVLEKYNQLGKDWFGNHLPNEVRQHPLVCVCFDPPPYWLPKILNLWEQIPVAEHHKIALRVISHLKSISPSETASLCFVLELEDNGFGSYDAYNQSLDTLLERLKTNPSLTSSVQDIITSRIGNQNRAIWSAILPNVLNHMSLEDAVYILSKNIKEMRIQDIRVFYDSLPNPIRQSEVLRTCLREHIASLVEEVSATDLITVMPILAELESIDKIASIVLDAIGTLDTKAQKCFLHQLPDKIKSYDTLFPLLTSVDQVAILWEASDQAIQGKWHCLSIPTRIRLVFRCAKENRTLDIDSHAETHPLVQSLLLLAQHKQQPNPNTFTEVHALIENFVIERAFESDSLLELRPLLPNCGQGKIWCCEGRVWSNNKNNEAWCPHLGYGCSIKNVDGGFARLTSISELSWQDWSLSEMLNYAGVTPHVEGLSSPDDYVPKLSGWVNRLNKIRKHLKCSRCQGIMKPNYQYAKFLARYNVTVFSCPEMGEHDTNVYLNHCWACEKQIIDSRECCVQQEGYYLCLNCGSGPRESKDYTQGDICPKCGLMMPKGKRQYQCSSHQCRHKIHLPPDNKMTGPRG